MSWAQLSKLGEGLKGIAWAFEPPTESYNFCEEVENNDMLGI